MSSMHIDTTPMHTLQLAGVIYLGGLALAGLLPEWIKLKVIIGGDSTMHSGSGKQIKVYGRKMLFTSRAMFGCLVLFATLVAFAFKPGGQNPTLEIETVAIDAAAPAQPFPHFWESVFGSGRAVLSLREAYRNDLRRVKSITQMQYVRCHAIFHDEIGLYSEDRDGNAIFNFTYIDQIYDGFLEYGVRPFVELDFMPRQLASSVIEHPFWYKPIVAPPKDWSRWEELVYRFAQHLVDRYGIDEVAHWYFEVWNEPNIDFWAGQPKESTYYELYDRSARALKRVSPKLQVGGPATAQAAWVDRFIEHCIRSGTPVDFVSTHVYANDTSKDVFGFEESIPRRDMVSRAVRKVYDQVKNSARPDLPIHWSEFNASYMNEVDVTDSPFMGPWLANTIRQCDGLVTTMSYWTFSDVFEEQGVAQRPFYGGFGLIAPGSIPKASFNVFKLLHMLGEQRTGNNSESAITTRRPDGSLALAIWNYAAPGTLGPAKRMILAFRNLRGRQHVRIHYVDRDHGSALTAWDGMGRPQFPSQKQQEALRKAAELPPAEERSLTVRAGQASTQIELPSHCLALVEVIK
jgi:xylan 1,4-beta-xylosidase